VPSLCMPILIAIGSDPFVSKRRAGKVRGLSGSPRNGRIECSLCVFQEHTILWYFYNIDSALVGFDDNSSVLDSPLVLRDFNENTRETDLAVGSDTFASSSGIPLVWFGGFLECLDLEVSKGYMKKVSLRHGLEAPGTFTW